MQSMILHGRGHPLARVSFSGGAGGHPDEGGPPAGQGKAGVAQPPGPAGTKAARTGRARVWGVLVRKEARDALRNRWFVCFSAAFALLTPSLAWLAHAGSGMAGFGGFGATAASLVDLVMLMVPLMAVTTGALGVAGDRERGFLAYLLAQPVGRTEVFLCRYVGQALCLVAALGLGFGLGGTVMALQGGAAESSIFLRLLLLSAVLALAMLAVGMAVSSVARRSSTALGAALGLWLVFVFLGDLGLMAGNLLFRLGIQDLFYATLVNPLECFRLGVVLGFDRTLDVLGPAGLFASDTFGNRLLPLLLASLAGWTAVPLLIGGWIFARRPL